MMRHFYMWQVLWVAIILTGCDLDDKDDLTQWMLQLRATTRPNVQPIREPVQFFPQDYTANDGVVPFDPVKLTQALRRESSQNTDGAELIMPELNRRKEPLEAYPLDAMVMVGSLNKEGMPTALLKVDNLLYQVRLGSYLGQNYGKIVGITEVNIQLREIVQDSIGDWEERMTTLELQATEGN